MLLDGKTLLDVANANNFAVPAFNISDYAMFNGVIDISEERSSPVIIAIHPDELSHIGVDLLPAIISRAHRSSVPVTVHLDHGANVNQILTAIQAGFTSVMIDGSLLPFEENIAITKRVVEVAHAVGLSVEGELGTIGKTDDEAEAGTATIIYTDPEDAAVFIEATGVDSLAVAIGTCHGIYPSWMKPELKLDLLEQLKAKVSIPLVLHGGSNNPDAEIGQSVKLGVNKINISSDIKVAYAAQKIDLFDAAGKAGLY